MRLAGGMILFSVSLVLRTKPTATHKGSFPDEPQAVV